MREPMHTWVCACEYKHVDAYPGLRCACGRQWDRERAPEHELADYCRRVCGDAGPMAAAMARAAIAQRGKRGDGEAA